MGFAIIVSSLAPLSRRMIGGVLASALWMAAGLVAAPVPGLAQDTSAPDEQGGTPLLQGGVTYNDPSGSDSSGTISGGASTGDNYNTNTGDPNPNSDPSGDPGNPAPPPVIPGNVTSNNAPS